VHQELEDLKAAATRENSRSTTGKAKCARCKKSHRVSVCDDGSRTKTPAAQTNLTSVGRIEVTSPGFTYLQTAQVRITGPTGFE
jgi:hypothetical protein